MKQLAACCAVLMTAQIVFAQYYVQPYVRREVVRTVRYEYEYPEVPLMTTPATLIQPIAPALPALTAQPQAALMETRQRPERRRIVNVQTKEVTK